MKRIISIFSMLAALLLMLLPFGVAMTFAPGPSQYMTKYFSYFSMTPVGYGNWFPIIIAVLSIIILLLLIFARDNENIKKTVLVLLGICLVASILSWILFSSFTFTGLCIMLIFLIVFAVQISKNYGSGRL